jgi:putative oxidoreductase
MNGIDDGVILVARLFLAALYLVFGVRKLRDWQGTVAQMAGDGVATPRLASLVAVGMEVPVAFAVAAGAFTRPLAVLMALYTLGTSLIEHRYWAVKGPGWLDKMEAFYKNLAIMGGFLLLFVTGAGAWSIDAVCGLPGR